LQFAITTLIKLFKGGYFKLYTTGVYLLKTFSGCIRLKIGLIQIVLGKQNTSLVFVFTIAIAFMIVLCDVNRSHYLRL